MRKRQAARRRTVGAVLVVLVAAGTWYGVAGRTELAGGPGSTTTTTSSDPTTTTTVPPTTTTTTTTAPATHIATVGTYQVGTAQLSFVRTPGTPSQRTLPVTIWYPETAGERPLIVFSQGFWSTVSEYGALLDDWASAGFVVVAPTYPHTNTPPHEGTPATPTGTNVKDGQDIVNHPADLKFVIATVLANGAQSGDPLSGRVNPNEVGLAGHSDGADLSLAVAANTADFTPRVKAVAVLSGAELSDYFGGTYFTPKLPTVPLLAVQSRTDSINFPACSVQLYDGARSPKWYLQLSGITHQNAYIVPGTYQTVVAEVTARFFTSELEHQPSAMASVASIADTSMTTISNGPTAPPQGGTPTCDAEP